MVRLPVPAFIDSLRRAKEGRRRLAPAAAGAADRAVTSRLYLPEVELEALDDRHRLGEERLEVGRGTTSPTNITMHAATGGVEKDPPSALLPEVEPRRVARAWCASSPD